MRCAVTRSRYSLVNFYDESFKPNYPLNPTPRRFWDILLSPNLLYFSYTLLIYEDLHYSFIDNAYNKVLVRSFCSSRHIAKSLFHVNYLWLQEITDIGIYQRSGGTMVTCLTDGFFSIRCLLSAKMSVL